MLRQVAEQSLDNYVLGRKLDFNLGRGFSMSVSNFLNEGIGHGITFWPDSVRSSSLPSRRAKRSVSGDYDVQLFAQLSQFLLGKVNMQFDLKLWEHK